MLPRVRSTFERSIALASGFARNCTANSKFARMGYSHSLAPFVKTFDHRISAIQNPSEEICMPTKKLILASSGDSVRVDETPVGKGVFAARSFPRGSVIGEITGDLITDDS